MSNINIIIYDSKGNIVKQLISDKIYSNGKYKVKWYGDNNSGQKVSKGVYFYKLISDGQMLVKKAIVVK